MKPKIDALMSRVMDLTRQGQLQEATAAIQAALQGGGLGVPTPAPAAADGEVIDVEARVVPDAAETREAPSPEPEPAPTRPDMPGRVVDGSHTERAGTRAYRLYVPPGAEGRARPLVVMLHGCTQDPDDFARGTRMNEAAERLGFYVLYPAQSREHNPQGCWNWFKRNHQQAGRGEPQILAGMTRALITERGIDPTRVYVAGLSAGGAMAAILGDAYPDLFAAVGVHSGLATGAAQDLPSAMAAMQGRAPESPRRQPRRPTIVFHGDQDHTVHPVNGERVMAGTPTDIEATKGQRSGTQGRRYTQHVHRDAQGRVVGEHWVVHGAGHAWSGGSAAGSHTDPSGPDATAEMLRFFGLQPTA